MRSRVFAHDTREDALNMFTEGYYGASRVTRKWVLGSVDVDVDGKEVRGGA